MQSVILCRVPDRAKSRWQRILLLATVGILLVNSSLVLPDCTAALAQRGNGLHLSSSEPLDPGDDPACCAFCLCCHFLAITGPAGVGNQLLADGFIGTAALPLFLQPAIGPFDRPPRA